jgi:heme exporter protein B
VSVSADSPDAASSPAAVARIPVRRRKVSWVQQATIVFMKDLVLEARSGEVVINTAFFGFVVVVMSSMAYYVSPRNQAQIAAGAIWLSMAFAAVLSLTRSWQREKEAHALDGLLVSPLSPAAFFCGKALGLWAFLTVVELVVIPSAALFMNIDLGEHGLGLAAIALCATPGISASGTLFGAMTVRTQAGALVIGIVLLPLLAPTLLTAVVASRNYIDGFAFSELGSFFLLMLVFDAVFIAGGAALFGPVVDGG